MKGLQADQPLAAGTARDRGLLLIAQVALLVPFLDKPVHIDDAFFLAIGRHIADAPLAPFGFDYNWAGTPASVWAEMKNPPGLFYLHAALQRAFGPSERALHLVFWFFPVCATQACYELARRVTRAPLYAGLLLAVCPAFWVSSTSLMLDVPVVAAMTLALVLGCVAQERDGLAWRWGAGLAAAVAVTLKYFGLAVVPLLAVQAWWGGRLRARDGVAVGFPLLVFAAWWGLSDGHFSQALAYRSEARGDVLGWVLTHGLAGAFFLGGLLAFPVVMLGESLAHAAGRGHGLIAAGFGVAAGLFHAAWLPDGLLVNDLLAGVLAAAGFRFLTQSFSGGWQQGVRRIVLVWLAGTVIFALFLNWTLNARTLCLLAPPAVLVFAWQTDGRRLVRAVALGVALVLGGMVNAGDAELAGFGPDETARVQRDLAGESVQFAGHWGFQHYMEAAGYVHVDLAAPDFSPGTVLVAPRMHQVANGGLAFRGYAARLVHAWPRRVPVAVMDADAGAGLHGSFLGLLPFAFATGPLESVEVLRW